MDFNYLNYIKGVIDEFDKEDLVIYLLKLEKIFNISPKRFFIEEVRNIFLSKCENKLKQQKIFVNLGI